MSVRRTILIEPYGPLGMDLGEPPYNVAGWCAREYVQHGDESRTTEVLFSAPSEDEVREWYAGYLRGREA